MTRSLTLVTAAGFMLAMPGYAFATPAAAPAKPGMSRALTGPAATERCRSALRKAQARQNSVRRTSDDRSGAAIVRI